VGIGHVQDRVATGFSMVNIGASTGHKNELSGVEANQLGVLTRTALDHSENSGTLNRIILRSITHDHE
jgi:hypothetical protein